MTVRRSAYEPSSWGTPDQGPVVMAGLLIASAVWLLLFLWLAWRLWHVMDLLKDPVNLVLAMLCVLLGVAVVLGWMILLPRSQAWDQERRLGKSWTALSVEEAHDLTPSEFESYVAYRLFERHGFRVENTRDVKDGGVDILATDPLGRQTIVQCKRYSNTVGSPAVRDLYGTMIDAGAIRAYLVTSGRISRDAYEWVGDKNMSLIDGERLADLASAEPALDVVKRRGEEIS